MSGEIEVVVEPSIASLIERLERLPTSPGSVPTVHTCPEFPIDVSTCHSLGPLVVYVCEPSLLPAAKLYAHAVGSRVEVITTNDFAALTSEGADTAGLLLASPELWTPEVLRVCAQARCALWPAARSLRETLAMMLSKLPRVLNKPADEKPALYASVDFIPPDVRGASELGWKAMHRSYFEPGPQYGVVTIAAHSDGVDAPLPGSRVLCPLAGDRDFSHVDPTRAPRCLNTNRCYRKGFQSREEVRGLTPPSRFSGDVVVLASCYGITPGQSPLASDFALGPNLFWGTETPAILTFHDIIFEDGLLPLLLSALLLSGASAEEAAYLVNSRDTPASRCDFVTTIGDPRVVPSRPSQALGAYAREIASRCLERFDADVGPAATPTTRQGLQALTHALDLEETSAQTPALLEAYMSHGRTMPPLITTFGVPHYKGQTTCHWCGEQAREMVVHEAQRILTVCPCCDEVLDRAIDRAPPRPTFDRKDRLRISNLDWEDATITVMTGPDPVRRNVLDRVLREDGDLVFQFDADTTGLQRFSALITSEASSDYVWLGGRRAVRDQDGADVARGESQALCRTRVG
ncbi:MAG: hypothetical protein AAF605_05490 [Myxococcota bacterium]